jgi:hypothetical protein
VRTLRLLSWCLCLACLASEARADDVAPGLAESAREDDAREELALLLSSRGEAERHRVRGVYVAIMPSDTDPLAMPACDDDGDYVVVVSRAMLALVDHVAYAWASDRLRGTHLVEAYGALLSRSQIAGTRPLPPPLGEASPSSSVGELAHAFSRDALAFVLADELSFAVRGALECPHPTVTHEHGDDEWTASEHALAFSLAPSRMRDVAAADAWARAALTRAGRSLVPAKTLLDVLAPLEAPGAAQPQPFGYVVLHPKSSDRERAF